MGKPQIGSKATCAMCFREIEFSGDYWRHVGVNFRHLALPVAIDDDQTDLGASDDRPLGPDSPLYRR